MCMLLEHLLHPTRPETGEPSLHDVRVASALPEPRGIGGRPSCQASEAGIRGWQGQGSSQRTLSSWIHRSAAQPTSQQELQMLRQIIAALCKLCLRQVDALNLHSLETRFFLFCSNHPQGLPAQLWKVAKQGGEAVENSQGGAQSAHVTPGHDGDVHPRADQAAGGGLAPEGAVGGTHGLGGPLVDEGEGVVLSRTRRRLRWIMEPCCCS